MLLITLPLAVLSVINTLYDRQHAAEDTYARTRGLVSTGSAVIQELVHQTDLLLATIGRTTNPAGERCTGDLQAALATGDTYRNLYAVSADGTVLCTAEGEPLERDVSQVDWFRRTQDRQEVTLTVPAEGLATGDRVMIISLPKEGSQEPDEAPSTTDVPADVLAASLEPDESIAFTEELAETLPPETIVQVLDTEGQVVARSTAIEQYYGVTAPLYPRLQDSALGDLEGKGVDGIERLYSYQRIEVGGETLYVMAGISRAEAYAEANRRLPWSLGIVVVLGLGMGAVALAAGARRRGPGRTPPRRDGRVPGRRRDPPGRRRGRTGRDRRAGHLLRRHGRRDPAAARDQQRLLDQLEEASEAERQAYRRRHPRRGPPDPRCRRHPDPTAAARRRRAPAGGARPDKGHARRHRRPAARTPLRPPPAGVRPHRPRRHPPGDAGGPTRRRARRLVGDRRARTRCARPGPVLVSTGSPSRPSPTSASTPAPTGSTSASPPPAPWRRWR